MGECRDRKSEKPVKETEKVRGGRKLRIVSILEAKKEKASKGQSIKKSSIKCYIGTKEDKD